MNKYNKFLQILTREGNEHRFIATEFKMMKLSDAKYHDGMADQSMALSVRFQEVFEKELS